MNNYFWTMESFGADYPPEDAEKIIDDANGKIRDYIEKHPGADEDEISNFSALLWEMYCAGKF